MDDHEATRRGHSLAPRHTFHTKRLLPLPTAAPEGCTIALAPSARALRAASQALQERTGHTPVLPSPPSPGLAGSCAMPRPRTSRNGSNAATTTPAEPTSKPTKPPQNSDHTRTRRTGPTLPRCTGLASSTPAHSPDPDRPQYPGPFRKIDLCRTGQRVTVRAIAPSDRGERHPADGMNDMLVRSFYPIKINSAGQETMDKSRSTAGLVLCREGTHCLEGEVAA